MILKLLTVVINKGKISLSPVFNSFRVIDYVVLLPKCILNLSTSLPMHCPHPPTLILATLLSQRTIWSPIATLVSPLFVLHTIARGIFLEYKSGHTIHQGFPGSSDGKESACNVGDLGSIPGLGRSPRSGHGNSLLYSCQENPHGQRSLVGYSPWGHKESDTTE